MTSYEDFIAGKRLIAPPVGISNPPELNTKLFPFQIDITKWALRRGRAAIWADCGLGKGWMALEWARVVAAHTGGRVLILAPLAVAQQFKREGEKLGVNVTVCREVTDVRDGINVTNYDRLDRFNPRDFAGVVADESSCLKDYTSQTRNALIESFAATPFRLACTATPAPNDHMELGNHAEFLGVMTRTEMLSMFFCHDGGETQKWRIKGHAKKDFWQWMASWAINIKKPSDLGYADDGYDLPPLNIHEHIVDVDIEMAHRAGSLFAIEAKTLGEQRAARRASIGARVEIAAKLANESSDQWLLWCDLNDESAALAKAVRGGIEVKGSDSSEHKEQALLGFCEGRHRVLISKASICGWGLNMQNCSRVAYVGLSHSFEQWYQSVRRTWRFGQTRPVDCHVITSATEGAVVANLKRKARDADELSKGMVEHMAAISSEEIRATGRTFTEYEPRKTMRIPEWVGKDSAA